MVGVTLFDRWDRIICMNTSLRPSFWLAHLLASCRLSPAHSSCRVHKAALEGGPWPQACLTCGQCGPSPKEETERGNQTDLVKSLEIRWKVGRKDLKLNLGVAELHPLPRAAYLTPCPSPCCSAHTCSLTARTAGPLGRPCLVH